MLVLASFANLGLFMCLLPVGPWLQSDSLQCLQPIYGFEKESAVMKNNEQFLTEWKRRRKNYVCRFCHKRFVLQQDCDGHINAVHLKTKPYICNSCNCGFAYRRYLADHKKKCVWLLFGVGSVLIWEVILTTVMVCVNYQTFDGEWKKLFLFCWGSENGDLCYLCRVKILFPQLE